MFDITLITMGKLKEKFYISAAEEYRKRLGGYCKFALLELPEVRLPENPSPAEISAGLEKGSRPDLLKNSKRCMVLRLYTRRQGAVQREVCSKNAGS